MKRACHGVPIIVEQVDPRGYYRKFDIKYVNGDPLPSDAVTFVLVLNEDAHARKAALAYADSIAKVNPGLAEDLRGLVERFETASKH